MEFEVTTKGANVHSGTYDSMHLYRNGEVIQTGGIRRFWDFRQTEVTQYLKERVLDYPRENGIQYLKVDYNGSIGYGCDGAESPGEGGGQMQAVHRFFGMLRREYPELVIENCASGGHRLEPSLVKLTAMSSFSDAHECREIPYIAANLHQLGAAQAVPGLGGDLSRTWPAGNPVPPDFRNAGALLPVGARAGFKRGTMAGSEGRHAFLREGSGNHQEGKKQACADRQEQSAPFGRRTDLFREMEGKVLVIYHAFSNPPTSIGGILPEGRWKITDAFGRKCRLELGKEELKIWPQNSWEAGAVYLERG